VAVGADATLPPARRTIDAREQYVIPGLIDAHVHMGSEEDASIAEGLARNMPVETDGALHGGVTTFGHFVGQRNEPLVPNIEATIREGNRWSRVDYFFHAIVSTDGHHAELPAVWDPRRHVRSSTSSTPTSRAPPRGSPWLGGPSDAGMLLRSLRFCAERGRARHLHRPLRGHRRRRRARDELMAAGRTDLGAWSDARPNVAEYSRIAMAIDLARTARAPIYIAHMSTAEGADRVAAARRDGSPVWAEVTPHHLTHTGTMEAEVGCWGKVNPPLRAAADVDRLWRAFHDGGITCLGSDHGTGGRTHATKAKGGPKHGNIWNARSGNRGGLEHFLPVLMTFGVHAGRISIEDVARVGALNTAKVFGCIRERGPSSPAPTPTS
jgi:dihydroorotase-like cyclic amidohydrolase